VRDLGAEAGSPPGLDAAEFSLRTPEGGDLEAAVGPTQLPRAYALLLFDAPAGPDEETALRQAASDLLDALPPQTQTALYRRCSTLDQVAAFSGNRSELAALMTAENLACEGERMPLAEALALGMAEVAVAGGAPYPALRSLVLMAPSAELAGADPSAIPLGVDAYALVGNADPGTIAMALTVVEWDEASGPAGALPGFLEALAQSGTRTYTLGICLPAGVTGPLQLTTPEGAACEDLATPEGPPEESAMECDRAAIAAGQRHYPDSIEFIMTEHERKLFNSYAEEKRTDDFSLHVRIGGAAPVSAVAHLRGQTSLDCARKSFTVNLKGGEPRHLAPFFATDEFYLISMCKDDRYHQQVTANFLAADLGLFPLSFRLVELIVAGSTQGVYLLLEKRREGLLEEHSRVHTIVRRRFDPEGKMPDVLYPSDTPPDDPALDGYWKLVSDLEGLAGSELAAAAEDRFDLDGFLTAVAFHSLMGNGDWVDEMIFVSTESVRKGKRGERYDLMLWDMDDLYCSCHHSGKWAMPDEYGLLFCAEGNLEKRLLADPLIYARFVEILDGMIASRVTEETVEAALDKTAAILLPFFERPEICAAMVELLKSNPEATTPEVAVADIEAEMAQLRSDYLARRDLLLSRIKDYREATGQ
jgi:hypothetical protein